MSTFTYALTIRPVSNCTVLAGYLEFGTSAKWRHGTVTYAEELSAEDVER